MLTRLLIFIFTFFFAFHSARSQNPVITPKAGPIILKLNEEGKYSVKLSDVANVEGATTEPELSPDLLDCSTTGPQKINVTATHEYGKLYEPNAIAFDKKGNLYIADSYNFVVKKITPDGNVSIYLGNGKSDFLPGKGTAAGFGIITGIVATDSDELYMTDFNSGYLLKVTADAEVSLFSKISAPFTLQDLCINKGGGFFASSSSTIFQIKPDGSFTRVVDEDVESSSINDVIVDSKGNLYYAVTTQNVIKKLGPKGVPIIVAGDEQPRSKDGNGTKSSFWHPWGLGIDDMDNIYITEADGAVIRKMTPNGNVITIAGSGSKGDKNGSARESTFNTPVDVAVAPNGDLYIADYYNNSVRQVSKDGMVSKVNTSIATYVVKQDIPVIVATKPVFENYSDIIIPITPNKNATIPAYEVDPKIRNYCGVYLSIKQEPEAGLLLTPDVPVKITLTADDGYGGTANVSFKITAVVKPLVNQLFVPNTFTPNNDGLNDNWQINGLEFFEQSLVSVFNRYGNVIYRSKGYTRPFDGTVAGKQVPAGTYYYIIQPEPGSRTLSGSLTIIR